MPHYAHMKSSKLPKAGRLSVKHKHYCAVNCVLGSFKSVKHGTMITTKDHILFYFYASRGEDKGIFSIRHLIQNYP